jgi:hypothetical protein
MQSGLGYFNSVVHNYECFGEVVCVCLFRLLENAGSMSYRKLWYPPIRLHSPITQKITILNFNISHFLYIYIYLLQTK